VTRPGRDAVKAMQKIHLAFWFGLVEHSCSLKVFFFVWLVWFGFFTTAESRNVLLRVKIYSVFSLPGNLSLVSAILFFWHSTHFLMHTVSLAVYTGMVLPEQTTHLQA
jgi:hypothetical protein